MNNRLTLTSAPYKVAWQPSLPRANTSRLRGGLTHLLVLIATYRARRRFRHDLQRISKDNPHLVDDIGLTRWQAEAEIAKRFWQV